MDAVLLVPPPSAFVPKGKLFLKEVLREGTYQHPTDPWDEPLEVLAEDIEEIAESSNDAIEAGVSVTIPVGHTNDAEKNRGRVLGFRTGECQKEPGKRSIYAVMDVRNSDTAEMIRSGEIEEVSVQLDSYGDHKGNAWGLRIVHVALVPDPVFVGQESFVALARGSGKTSRRAARVLSYCGGKAMKKGARSSFGRMGLSMTPPVKVRRALSITRTVRKALGVAGIEVKSKRLRGDDLDALLSTLIEKANAAPTGIEPAAKALSRTADETFKELHGEREKRTATMVETATKSGRITKGMEGDLKALLSVRHGFSLGVDGKATSIDVAGTVEKVLAAIPDGACVPLAERIKAQNLSVAGGAPEGQPAEFDASKEIESRLKRLKAAGVGG